MNRYLKLLVGAVAAIFATFALVGCSASPSVDLKQYAAVIDVRTPQEFDAGHLKGALNIDIEGAAFTAEIEKLDKSQSYYIYCHSGNRAGQAITYMTGAGFTGTLTNGGALEDASTATGLAIVQK